MGKTCNGGGHRRRSRRGISGGRTYTDRERERERYGHAKVETQTERWKESASDRATHSEEERRGEIYLSLPRSQTFSTQCLNFEHTSWHDTAAPVRVRDMEGHGWMWTQSQPTLGTMRFSEVHLPVKRLKCISVQMTPKCDSILLRAYLAERSVI